jgi:hypothetical protein
VLKARQVKLLELPQSDSSHFGRVNPPTSKKSPVAEHLLAAKAVTWRGRGYLFQMELPDAPTGLFLVLELWGGVAGTLICMLAIGVRFIALSAEQDPEARAAVQRVMPNVVHLEKVEQIFGPDLLPSMLRRKSRAVVVGGGSPCQGNSSLNSSTKGLDDARSNQPEQVRRIWNEIQMLKKKKNHRELQYLDILPWLENVASCPPEVILFYNKLLNCDPLEVRAGQCGYVSRNRVLWCRSDSWTVADTAGRCPVSWELVRAGKFKRLNYIGAKPIPARVHFDLPATESAQVVKEQGATACHSFVRKFAHPTDRCKAASKEAVERFHQDGKRFPPSAYEEKHLLWRGWGKDAEWRTHSPSERAQMHGLPFDLVSPPDLDSNVAVARQNSWIGNGFHIPTIMVFLTLLLQCTGGASMAVPFYVVNEASLRVRLRGPVWELGAAAAQQQGCMQAEHAARERQYIFRELEIPTAIWNETRSELARLTWTTGTATGPMPAESGRLFGVMVRLSSQAHGRLEKRSLYTFGKRAVRGEHCNQGRHRKQVHPASCDTMPPRTLASSTRTPPVVVYSDASCTETACRLGWIVCAMQTACWKILSVPDHVAAS